MPDQDNRHPVVILHDALETAEKQAYKLSESDDWMGSMALLTVFEQSLKTHNRINKILDKTIGRVTIQLKAKNGGRF
jgi:hypothetical protein